MVDPEVGIGDEESDDEIDELQFLLFFKTCLVQRDLDILKIKLKQSIDMCERLMEKKGTEFHKTFPFYFVEPSLVRSHEQMHSKKLNCDPFYDICIFSCYMIMRFENHHSTPMHCLKNGRQ